MQLFRRSIAALLLVVGMGGCEEDFKGAEAEVRETQIKLDLPEVPAFEMPVPYPDGTHRVREMRLKGRKLFNTELSIRGHVLWIYDCVEELRKPDLSDKDIEKMIAEDPTKCSRPHFFLGDSPDTPTDKSVWVVEVPRKLRPDELNALSRAERAALPDVPDIQVGDEVVVTGTWNRESPKGFANSDGLLIYQDLRNLTAEDGEGE